MYISLVFPVILIMLLLPYELLVFIVQAVYVHFSCISSYINHAVIAIELLSHTII